MWPDVGKGVSDAINYVNRSCGSKQNMKVPNVHDLGTQFSTPNS